MHYAGFFDPGFGTEEALGAGSRAVLEVRSHETPFLLEDGQTVARLVFEPLTRAAVAPLRLPWVALSETGPEAFQALQALELRPTS